MPISFTKASVRKLLVILGFLSDNSFHLSCEKYIPSFCRQKIIFNHQHPELPYEQNNLYSFIIYIL